MRNDIRKSRQTLKELLDLVIATDEGGSAFPLEEALANSISMIIEQAKAGRKLLMIGNGASATIASHMAADFCKNAGIKALSFDNCALLTSISNDCGYEHVFEKPIEMFADSGDILLAISSSGKSENILRGVSAAKKKGVEVVTLSGFDEDNPLRKLGCINFYVPTSQYGHIEVLHLFLCHCLIDSVIKEKNG